MTDKRKEVIVIKNVKIDLDTWQALAMYKVKWNKHKIADVIQMLVRFHKNHVGEK